MVYANELSFKTLIGVDIGSNIIELAKKNTRHIRAQLYCMDALSFEPPSGKNLYFLYNPFDSYILKTFLESKKITNQDLFVYVNPLRGFVFEMMGFYKQELHYSKNHNRIVHLYSLR